MDPVFLLCFWVSLSSDVFVYVLCLGSSPHLGVGDGPAEMVQDPYEFLQSPEPGSTANS